MAATATKPILYSYFLSSCSWRVRIALAYKGIKYDYKGVDLKNNEHLQEDFLKLNPCAQVPALVIDGNVLTHSTAILEYLEETVPDPPLLPKNPVEAAVVRQIVDSIACGIQPFHNDQVLRYIGPNSFIWAKHWIQTGFQSIERILRNTHGKYCVGNNVTFADVCLVPQIFRANIYDVNMTDFPLIRAIASNLGDLCAFKEAHPFQQPDYPAYI
ncbi:maleylacetoacetate isomerase-like [Argiope bruennichi]|uniref:maleylacetoacetate isomerase n=1 Tax=Argiope bruennichi TaxID=94029 RepID=A0A8T0F2U0_ARGBR|nr:maleylacetoacetate isomerase-like [Argiope bruennichi]KAF8783238.1 Maleylacetoacetate isomerase like protein [Argiope bruennichi]